jgi:hypothetical protein
MVMELAALGQIGYATETTEYVMKKMTLVLAAFSLVAIGCSQDSGAPTDPGTSGGEKADNGADNACVSAGGSCVPLVPDACANGTVGDASEYDCGGGGDLMCCLPAAPQIVVNGLFTTDRAYTYEVFTPEECAQIHETHGGRVNCDQQVTFLASGRVRLLLEDIMSSGTYEVTDNIITIRLEVGNEGSSLSFQLSEDGATITQTDNGRVWNLT